MTTAIIAILAAILLSAVFAARASARKCQCISNLRQIGIALEMYSSDWQGWMLPEGGHFLRVGTIAQARGEDLDQPGRLHGLGKLYPAYLRDIEVLYCPVYDDRAGQIVSWNRGAPWVECGYVSRGARGGASGLFNDNSEKVLVMQFMREDRTLGNEAGHDAKSVPVLWGDGSARFFDCTLADVSFNPVTTVEPFFWADSQKR